jgi:hypothetical protein
MKLYKTTLVIWSEWDGMAVTPDRLGWEAMNGDAYCSDISSQLVENPEDDPDWDGTEFFIDPWDEEEEE